MNLRNNLATNLRVMLRTDRANRSEFVRRNEGHWAAEYTSG